jgi:hypothetical protein
MAVTPLAEFECGISQLSSSLIRLWDSFITGSSGIFQLRSNLEFYFTYPLLILSIHLVPKLFKHSIQHQTFREFLGLQDIEDFDKPPETEVRSLI